MMVAISLDCLKMIRDVEEVDSIFEMGLWLMVSIIMIYLMA